MSRCVEELTVKISAASSGSSGTEARIQELVDRVESVQEKMYDFEVNKRNNLLFYGVREDRRETPAELHNKVTSGHFAMELLLFASLHSSDPRHSPGQSLAEERHRSQLRLEDVLRSRCWRIQVEQRHSKHETNINLTSGPWWSPSRSSRTGTRCCGRRGC